MGSCSFFLNRPLSQMQKKKKKKRPPASFPNHYLFVENARSAGPNHICENLACVLFALSCEQEQLAYLTGNRDNYSRASQSWQDDSPTWELTVEKEHQSSTVPLHYSILARLLRCLIIHKSDDIQEIEQGSLEAWRCIRLKYVKLLDFTTEWLLRPGRG